MFFLFLSQILEIKRGKVSHVQQVKTDSVLGPQAREALIRPTLLPLMDVDRRHARHSEIACIPLNVRTILPDDDKYLP